MTTSLASLDDVIDRLGRPVDDEDAQTRINGLLDEASIDVLEYCRRDGFDDPVPDTVRIVVSRMVARALETPRGFVGSSSVEDQAGQFARRNAPTADASSGGVWLTKADKRKLRRLSLAYGAFSVDLLP